MAHLANLEEWIASTTDALQLSLVAPSKTGLQLLGSFSPKFTYPIFGDEEKVFGYKGLRMNLRFRANDMRPHFKMTQSKKFKAVGDAEPTNIVGVLNEGGHLPKGKRSLRTRNKLVY